MHLEGLAHRVWDRLSSSHSKSLPTCGRCNNDLGRFTPLCQERLKIEGYLNIPDYNCREYILERIHALSKSGGLAAYNWNAPTASKSANPFSSSLSSVMDFFGSPSNTSSSMSSSIFGRSGAASLNFDSSTLSSQPGGSSGLNASTSSQNPAGSSNPSGSTSNSSTPIKVPSDAELVMHLVCRFFDEQMGSPGAFSYKYVIPLDAKPDSTVSIQIQTKSRSPPHYNLVYRGRIWEMYAKRNNVFHVLAVFAYIVSTTAGGYLGLLNLGGKGVGMVTETGILDGPGRSAFLEEEEERRRKLRASHLQEVEAEAGTGSISGGIGGKENVDTVGSGSKSISFGESLGGGKRKF
ncbi:cytochrome B561, N terminal-domain-containing protein [Chytriomyces sp. MP71]|nr:cytochrome B561, N terminal-domain-containing protein [Chytriomyces sp. MP71]